MAAGSTFYHISFQSTFICIFTFHIYIIKYQKYIYLIILSLSDLTFGSGREGIDNPFIALVASSLFVCVGAWDFWGASYWIDTLVLKNWGKFLRYYCCITVSSSRKINASSRRSSRRQASYRLVAVAQKEAVALSPACCVTAEHRVSSALGVVGHGCARSPLVRNSGTGWWCHGSSSVEWGWTEVEAEMCGGEMTWRNKVTSTGGEAVDGPGTRVDSSTWFTPVIDQWKLKQCKCV